jgi:hypothetical protein
VEQFEAEHAAAAGTTNYYFLDQCSLNQHVFVTEHANEAQLQQQILQKLEQKMTGAGHVLFCLHPWNNPVPLQRAWCLFELFVAMRQQCTVTMCFDSEGAEQLQGAVERGHFNAAEMVGDIDAAAAGATNMADKDMIVALIEQSTGLAQFNTQIQKYLMAAMKGAVTGLLVNRRNNASTRTPRRTPRHTTRATLARDTGAAPAAGAVGRLEALIREQSGLVREHHEASNERIERLEGEVRIMSALLHEVLQRSQSQSPNE